MLKGGKKCLVTKELYPPSSSALVNQAHAFKSARSFSSHYFTGPTTSWNPMFGVSEWFKYLPCFNRVLFIGVLPTVSSFLALLVMFSQFQWKCLDKHAVRLCFTMFPPYFTMVHRRIDYFGSIKLPGRTKTSSDCSCQSTAPHRWSAHVGMPRIRQSMGCSKCGSGIQWSVIYWSQNIRIILGFIEGTQRFTFTFVLRGLKKTSYPLAWCMIMLASPHLTITISLWCPAIIFGQCCKERLYLWEKYSSGSNATVLDFSRNQQWIKQSRNAGIRALSKIPGGIALAMGLESEHFEYI